MVGYRPVSHLASMTYVAWRRMVGADHAMGVSGVVVFRARVGRRFVEQMLQLPSNAIAPAGIRGARGGIHKLVHLLKSPAVGCPCEVCNSRRQLLATAQEYEGAFCEDGQLPVVKKKSGVLTEAVRDIMAGARPIEVIMNRPQAAMYWRNLQSIEAERRNLQMQTQATSYVMPRVCVFIGPTNCHKSRSARELAYRLCREVPFTKQSENQWWDFYTGQKSVLFEEFEGKIDYNQIKSICDGYVFDAQVKCGTISLRPKLILFTANTEIDDWWPNLNPVHLAAFKRRIHAVYRPLACGYIHADKPCDCPRDANGNLLPPPPGPQATFDDVESEDDEGDAAQEENEDEEGAQQLAMLEPQPSSQVLAATTLNDTRGGALGGLLPVAGSPSFSPPPVEAALASPSMGSDLSNLLEAFEGAHVGGVANMSQ